MTVNRRYLKRMVFNQPNISDQLFDEAETAHRALEGLPLVHRPDEKSLLLDMFLGNSRKPELDSFQLDLQLLIEIQTRLEHTKVN